ncbi:M14 family metallopeptidase [Marinobacter hydrocarbonoclasticus]|nr:M14 family metallopeptidase [Marinobacter nauticus]
MLPRPAALLIPMLGLCLFILPPLVSFGYAQGLRATDLFSDSYAEARARFIEAAKASGGRLESYPHPLAGPNGETLYLDVLALGVEGAQRVLVLSSGTHGVEGFAGSAIQTGLLRTQALYDSGAGILMIHAINPWGFAHERRVNEHNVDLNRNFVDFSRPLPANPGYQALRSALTPASLSIWSSLTSVSRVLWYRIRHGSEPTREAITAGQYDDPDGLFYGGSVPSWSRVTLEKVMARYLNDAQHIAMVDVHTGLGDYASAEVIVNLPMASGTYQRAREWWGEQVKSTLSGDSVSAHLHGTLKLAIPAMVPHASVTAVSLEFGTYAGWKVLSALRKENWGYHHADRDSHLYLAPRQVLRTQFYPDDDLWKRQVWAQGEEVVRRAMTGLMLERD